MPPSNFIADRPKAALLFCLLLVVLLARCIPVVSIVYICLISILALRPVVVLSGESRQKQGRRLVDHKLVQDPSNFYCWPSQGGSSVLVLW